MNRRDILKLGGTGLLGITFAPIVNGCEEHSVGPAGDDGLSLAPAPFITPVEDFFVQHGGEGTVTNWKMPVLTKESWELKIVDDSVELGRIGWSELMAMRDAGKEVTILKTMQCIHESPLRPTQTGYTGTAYWSGIPLKHVLDIVGVDYANTKRLVFHGADSFVNNIEIARLTDAATLGLEEPLLVYAMNGRDLTIEHGFPVRLLLQEAYGFKNIKWLTQVRATVFNVAVGQYQQNGYSDDATMRVSSRSTNLREGVSVPAGQIAITGVAVSGHAPIDRVEVRIDGNLVPASYKGLNDVIAEANLPSTIKQIESNQRFPYRAVWITWAAQWNALRRPQPYVIEVRAIDQAANAQPDVDRDIADGHNAVMVYHVKVV